MRILRFPRRADHVMEKFTVLAKRKHLSVEQYLVRLMKEKIHKHL